MSTKTISIVVPPVWTGVYHNTARLLKFSLDDLGMEVTIMESGEIESAEGACSIVLGWNLLPDTVMFKRPYILYQLEPLCLEHWRTKMIAKRPLFTNALAVWDYSVYNLEHYPPWDLSPRIIPMGYHSKLEEVEPTAAEDFDVLFVGFPTDRRKRILEELNKHCCVSTQPRWGTDFVLALQRSKILLNVHQYETQTPLEQARIAYALNNHAFVISETSVDEPYPDLVTTNYDGLVQEVIEYLHNVTWRRRVKDLMFSSFKSISMSDVLKQENLLGVVEV